MTPRTLTGFLQPKERSGSATIHFNPFHVAGDATGHELHETGGSGAFIARPNKVLSLREFKIEDKDTFFGGSEGDWFRISDSDWTRDSLKVSWSCEPGARIREISFLVTGQSTELCVNVRDLGALGDGTDATQEIQQAVDLVASAGGGTVCIPRGLYIIRKAIKLKDRVHLRGSGRDVTTLQLRDNVQLTAAAYNAFEGSVLKIQARIGTTVSALRIDGNKSKNRYFGRQQGFDHGDYQCGIAIISDPPHPLPPPALLKLSTHCLVEDCWVSDCVAAGIYVEGSQHITIRNCASHDNGYDVCKKERHHDENPCHYDDPDKYRPWGIILVDRTRSCVVEGCSAFGNPHGGIECWSTTSQYHQIRYCHADSIYVNVNSPKYAPVYHSIIGCVVDNRRVLHHRKSPDHCIGVYASASHVTIRDCHSITAYGTGIFFPRRVVCPPEDLENNPRRIAILNNRIELAAPLPPDLQLVEPPPNAGMYIGDCNDFIISGNVVTGAFYNGIHLLRCRQGSVQGNILTAIRAKGVASQSKLKYMEYWDGDTSFKLEGRGIQLQGCQEVTTTANSIRGFEIGVLEGTLREKRCPEVEADYNIILGNVLRNNGRPTTPEDEKGKNSEYAHNISNS